MNPTIKRKQTINIIINEQNISLVPLNITKISEIQSQTNPPDLAISWLQRQSQSLKYGQLGSQCQITGAGLFISKPDTCKRFKDRERCNLRNYWRKHFNKWIYIGSINIFDQNMVYICKLDIEFDSLLGSDFLEHYNCVIDFNEI